MFDCNNWWVDSKYVKRLELRYVIVNGREECHLWDPQRGKRAGFMAQRYRMVSLTKPNGSRTNIPEHRIIYAKATGKRVFEILDHIDRNKVNNHPSNLREVTNQESLRNREFAVSQPKNGIWRRQIVLDGGKVIEKRSKDIEVVEQWHREMKLKHHGVTLHGRVDE